MNLKIDFCSYDSALYACQYWHYSRSIPACKLFLLGVWEDNKFIGVVIFSRGASPHLLKKYGLKQTEGCELTRVALNKHITPVSRIIAIAIRILKKNNPGLRIIISFADPERGHHGGIYQAGGWIYTGESDETTEYFIGGRWRHTRNGYHRATVNTPTRIRAGKYRYIYLLDDSLRDKIELIRKPYPRPKHAAAGSPSAAAV
jgi:hypothetical protein